MLLAFSIIISWLSGMLRCTSSSTHIASIFSIFSNYLFLERVTFAVDNDDVVMAEVFIFSLFFIMVLIVDEGKPKEFATYT